VPPIEVEEKVVWCDGGMGGLGHPRVYLELQDENPVTCNYCGLRFVQKHGKGHHHH